jgi:hypothetical protein
MESFAILGAAAAIAQFIDFGASLCSATTDTSSLPEEPRQIIWL